MNKEVPISIVLPTYNVAKYISRALESLINQTYKNFEIIIVDDCGSDSSMEIANSYAENDSRIKIINNSKNLGTYHARRVGAESALGEYIVFLDPDDELSYKTINELQLKIREEGTDIIFFDIKPSVKRKWYEKAPYIFPISKMKSLLVSYFSNGTRSYLWGTAGKVYKNSFIKKVYSQANVDENFRFVYAEDVFLLVHAMLMKPSYSCVYYQGYVIHDNETSITQSDICEGDTKILQYDFMVESFLKRANEINLTHEEASIVNFLKNKLLADRFLLIRNSSTAIDYFKYVYKSFILIPNLTKAIRISLFILSLSLLRL